jgi:hypothetical protein
VPRLHQLASAQCSPFPCRRASTPSCVMRRKRNWTWVTVRDSFKEPWETAADQDLMNASALSLPEDSRVVSSRSRFQPPARGAWSSRQRNDNAKENMESAPSVERPPSLGGDRETPEVSPTSKGPTTFDVRVRQPSRFATTARDNEEPSKVRRSSFVTSLNTSPKLAQLNGSCSCFRA